MVGIAPFPNLFLTPGTTPLLPRCLGLSTELSRLFESGSLETLRGRLDELVQEAFRDPTAADEYSDPAISRFVCLTDRSLRREDRELLWRLAQGKIPLLEVVRAADRDEVASVQNYDGMSNPLEGLNEKSRENVLVYGIRLFVGEEALKPALIQSAEEILREMDVQERPGEDLSTALFRLHQKFSKLSVGAERVEAWRQRFEISSLMTREGMTDLLPFRISEFAFQYPEADSAMHSVAAGLHLFTSSPNPFDKARLYHAFPDLLAWFERYDSELARLGDVSPSPILMDLHFGDALSALAVFAGVELIEKLLKEYEGQRITYADSGTISIESILSIKHTKEPIEVNLQDIPAEVSDMARRIEIPEHGNLWSYLGRNVDRVVFTSQFPNFDYVSMNSLDPEAVANRLLKKVVIRVEKIREDNAAMKILHLLAHEAYHIASFRETSIKGLRLSRARLLEERNAHLFTAMVLEEIVKANAQAGTKGVLSRLGHFRSLGLAANLPLGYPVGDDTLRFDLPEGLDEEVLSRYPTFYSSSNLLRTSSPH